MWCSKTDIEEDRSAVLQFIVKHQDQLVGVLSGFDRLVLRGSLRGLSYVQGMMQYLWAQQVLLKDFAAHV
jgi:predicted PolB exonuclease-like 3'-5' exonuclease